MSKPYSVLLLYPKYFQDTGCTETYFAHIHAENARSAIQKAKEEVTQLNLESGVNIESAADFILLGVFAGHIELELGSYDE